MTPQELRKQSQEYRAHADELEQAADMLERLAVGPTAGITIRRARAKVSPAGARKSIFHPNETDVKVLDTMLSFQGDEAKELTMSWVVEQSGLNKGDVQKAIKWLNSSDRIVTHGRGRGTYYTLNVDQNDLQPVDPDALGSDYRRQGGPTVKAIVRAVFNSLEPAFRVSPADVTLIAQNMFPESKLTRQSFGQIFTKLAKEGDLLFQGDGRSRKYWRGTEKLEGAAEVPEGFDVLPFLPKSEEDQEVVDTDTPEDTVSDTDTDNVEAVAS